MHGRQNPEGDLGAGVPVDAPVGVLGAVAAKTLMEAGYRGQPGVGLPQNVVGAAKDLGPVTKTAAPDIDEPGVHFLEEAVTLVPPVKGAGAVAFGKPIGHLHQGVEGLLHLVQVVVHGDVVLVGIGVQIPHTCTGHGPGVVQGIEIGLVEMEHSAAWDHPSAASPP